MNSDSFYSIFLWMSKELHLRDKEEKVYAVIYSFTNTGKNTCNASLSTLAELCNTSKSSVQRAINSLLKKKLIAKRTHERNNQTYCEYMAINVEENRRKGRMLTGLLKEKKEKGESDKLNALIEKYKF